MAFCNSWSRDHVTEFFSTKIGKSIKNYVDMQNFMSLALKRQIWHPFEVDPV